MSITLLEGSTPHVSNVWKLGTGLAVSYSVNDKGIPTISSSGGGGSEPTAGFVEVGDDDTAPALASRLQFQGAVVSVGIDGIATFNLDARYRLAGATITWSEISSGSRPTTLNGYGILDAYTRTQLQTPGSSFVAAENLTGALDDARLSANVARRSFNQYTNYQEVIRASGAAFAGRVTGEASIRWHVDVFGVTWWGHGLGGATPYDTNLYRHAADWLRTDDKFSAGSFAVGTTEIITPGRSLQNVTMNAALLTGTVSAEHGGFGLNLVNNAGRSMYFWDGTVDTWMEIPIPANSAERRYLRFYNGAFAFIGLSDTIPTGGTAGQLLQNTGTSGSASWGPAIPSISGGAIGDVLKFVGTPNGVLTWDYGSVAWGELDGVPLSFPPSSHTHSAADITSGVFALARIPSHTHTMAQITEGTLDPARGGFGMSFTGLGAALPYWNGTNFLTLAINPQASTRYLTMGTDGSLGWSVGPSGTINATGSTAGQVIQSTGSASSSYGWGPIYPNVTGALKQAIVYAGLTGGIPTYALGNVDWQYIDSVPSALGQILPGSTNGSISVSGQIGGYAGIRFTTAGASTLLIQTTVSLTAGNHGLWHPTHGWIVQWSGKTLQIGDVPWARVTGAPVYTTRWPTASEIGAQPAHSALSQIAVPITYGSITVQGSTQNYAGIRFSAVGRTFMVSDVTQGIYNYGTSEWQWYFTNGTLIEGYIPWGRIIATTAANVEFANITASGDIQANLSVAANGNSSNNAGGLSLYGSSSNVQSYGIAFRGTGYWSTHGYVTGDWAMYFTMDGTTTRGWVFRHRVNGNVASINAGGNARFMEVMSGGWFRNNDEGKGLYNEINSHYWYAEAGYWRSRSTNGFQLRNISNSNRGYLFFTESGQFGLLNMNGEWRVETRSTTGGNALHGGWEMHTGGLTLGDMGNAGWGTVLVQGRVWSANASFYISPPSGNFLYVTTQYRGAGGTSGGVAGIKATGDLYAREGSSSIAILGQHATWPGYIALWRQGNAHYSLLANADDLFLACNSVSGAVYIRRTNNNTMGKFDSGGLTVYGVVTANSFFTSSSRAVKHDIRRWNTSGMEVLRGVKVVGFRYNHHPEEQEVGFIAEDTHPLLVTRDRKFMKPGTVTGILIKSVQELENRVRMLEEENAMLRSRAAMRN